MASEIQADPARPAAATDAAASPLPRITVIRVRRNGVRDLAAGPLVEALARSSLRETEFVEVGVAPENKTGSFLLALRDVLSRARGELVHVVCDEAAPAEDLHAAALAAAAAAPAARAVLAGVRIESAEGEVVLAAAGMDRFAQLTARAPALAAPDRLLSLFLVRPAQLMALTDEALDLARQGALGPSDELALAQRFFLGLRGLGEEGLVRLAAPLTTIREPLTARRGVKGGLALLEQGRPDQALAVLDELKARGELPDGARFLRVAAKLRLGRVMEAVQALRAILAGPEVSLEALEAAEALLPAELRCRRDYGHVAAAVERVEGYVSPDQERYLFEKTLSLPWDASILEVGCYYGRSTSALAFACAGTDRRILAVDTFFGNDGPMGRSELFLDVWRWNLGRYDLGRYAEPLPGFSFEVLPTLPADRKFDFAFIDASHEFEDVMRDFALVYPLVKDGGWIALHDVEPGWPGAWRVWRQSAGRLLTDHEFRGSLAAGRKQPGRPFRDFAETNYCYAEDWALYLGELGQPVLAPLVQAMLRTARLFRAADAADQGGLAECETLIAAMPAPLKTTLRHMTSKEGEASGPLRYWNALIMGREGRGEEARAELARAVELCAGPFQARLRRLSF